jgi:hypothetical protein
MASAGRLLAAEDSAGEATVWPEHGLMLSLMALNELATGQVEPGLEHARAAYAVGQRTGDPDIQALGLVFQGFGLVHQGRLDDGRALLDEAMASATAGHLGTLAQGMVYCRTLSACIDTFDYRRAIEWTEEIERRAPSLGTVGFPGDCRTHRAAVLVVRGDWERGAEEAEAAAAAGGPRTTRARQALLRRALTVRLHCSRGARHGTSQKVAGRSPRRARRTCRPALY